MRRPGRERERREPVPERGGTRSFVAILLPDALRRQIDEAATPLRRRAAELAVRVSWVPAESFHLTLRFLGAIDEVMIGRVREALDEAAAATAPFAVELGGIGAFPPGRSPRVFWVGLTAGADALAAHHARIERTLASRGVPPEGRPFHGHVTLGRVRDPRGAPGLDGLLGKSAPTPLGEARVDAIHLMRSDLDPAGSRYSVLARVALGGGAPASAAGLT